MRYPPRSGDGWGYGVFSEAGLVVQALKSFALIALRLPKVCDLLSQKPSLVFGGAVTRLAAR
jgi:hypothetical protein